MSAAAATVIDRDAFSPVFALLGRTEVIE